MPFKLHGAFLFLIVIVASGCKTSALPQRQFREMLQAQSQAGPQASAGGSRGELSTTSSERPISAAHRQLQTEYIGLTVAEARTLAAQQERAFRIGREDGVSYPLTFDRVPGRITASVEDGVVRSIERYEQHSNWAIN